MKNSWQETLIARTRQSNSGLSTDGRSASYSSVFLTRELFLAGRFLSRFWHRALVQQCARDRTANARNPPRLAIQFRSETEMSRKLQHIRSVCAQAKLAHPRIRENFRDFRASNPFADATQSRSGTASKLYRHRKSDACAFLSSRYSKERYTAMMQSSQHKEHVVVNPRRVRRLALNVKSALLAGST